MSSFPVRPLPTYSSKHPSVRQFFTGKRVAIHGAQFGPAGRWISRRSPADDITAGSGGGAGSDSVGAGAPQSTPSQPPFAGDEPRVLILDDEASVRRVCTFALRGLGWRPEGEGSAPVVLARIAAGERFEVIVLDYAMPEMNGLEFLRALAALPATAHRPQILMASAHADGAVARQAMQLGVWDFLSKPLMPDDLRRRTRRLLQRATRAAQGEQLAGALACATRCDWAGALRSLEGLALAPAPLLRGLLRELAGDPEAACLDYARAYWNTRWSEGDAEVWSELSQRLDCDE